MLLMGLDSDILTHVYVEQGLVYVEQGLVYAILIELQVLMEGYN